MPERRGISLPGPLMRELGLPTPDATYQRSNNSRSGSSRKADRKAARVQKKTSKKPIPQIRRRVSQAVRRSKDEVSSNSEDDTPPQAAKVVAKNVVQKPKTILREPLVSKDAVKADLPPAAKGAKLPRRVRERLDEDDAEIAALERKLGMKGKKKLPKSFEEDGLGDLLGDLAGSDLDGEENPKQKKQRLSQEETEWLEAKRRKAISVASKPFNDDEDDEDDENGDDQILSDSDVDIGESDGSADLLGDSDVEDFDGFDEDVVEEAKPTRKRENPYIAPQAGNGVKYIPPSLRKADAADTEGLERLRRQLNGTLNRLSEAKVLSIAADVEKIYRENARQHISTVLLDTLFTLVCDPAPLQDTFMILHAGFVAALYKTIGTEFGAQIVQRLVDEYDRLSNSEYDSTDKRIPNLITFLAELYNFQVIGSTLIYDFIRKLTSDLSEDNAELLLRIARISGSQLRTDDSASLKDIVTLLHASVAKIGADKLSIRTKFMIETIENLKNNKVKTGLAASTIKTEHTTAMKKMIGSMNRSSIKASEPIRIGLEDIRNVDKKGKWWLVGASFKDNTQEAVATITETKKNQTAKEYAGPKEVDPEQLAREQGMNTEIRRAIFISIVSAYDYKEACTRLTKLGMKSKQRLEIPRVVVHCVGAEKLYYNRFYTKIAKQLCKERSISKAFSFALWDVFKRIEDEEDGRNEDNIGQLDVTSMVYIGKMYGELVADGIQSILLLKHLDLAHPSPKLKTFAEVFLITIFQQLIGESSKGSEDVRRVISAVERAPEMIASLQLFLRKTVRKSLLVRDVKDKERVKSGCKAAESVLLKLMSNGIGRTELSDLI